MVKGKTWSPRAKVPYHYKVPVHQYTCSEGLKPVLLSPYTTQCIGYLVLCNRSHENSGLKEQ